MVKKHSETQSTNQSHILESLELNPTSTIPSDQLSKIHSNVFLNILQELQSHDAIYQSQSPEKSIKILKLMDDLMVFFNSPVKYQQADLLRSTICLANFLNMSNSSGMELRFNRHFKSKIMRYMRLLMQNNGDGLETIENSVYRHYKQTSILYIAVFLLYKSQNLEENSALKKFTNSLFQDHLFISKMLKINVIKERKVLKLYGIILVFILNSQTNQKINQKNRTKNKNIVEAVHKNLQHIPHEITLYNLILCLRYQKNKIHLKLQDLLKYNVIDTLMLVYKNRSKKYQTYQILDYIDYLTSLFPVLGQKIVEKNFIEVLLNQQKERLHPLEIKCAMRVICSGVRFYTTEKKENMLPFIFLQNNGVQGAHINTDFNKQIKILFFKAILMHEYNLLKIYEYFQKDCLWYILKMLQKSSSKSLMQTAMESILLFIQKISNLNKSLSVVMLNLTLLKIDELKGGQIDEEMNDLFNKFSLKSNLLQEVPLEW